MGIKLIDLLFQKTKGRSKYFYNIMPIDNIPSVVKHGILSYNCAMRIQHSSIAMNEVQERREKVIIPNGRPLHQYANLYFTYHNPMMYKRRKVANTICLLVIYPSIIETENCILSDRNAETNMVKFYTPYEGVYHIDFDLVFAQSWTDDDPYIASNKKAIKCAEILIPDCIPFNYIVGAIVLNEEVKDRLIELGFSREILIRPKMFFN